MSEEKISLGSSPKSPFTKAVKNVRGLLKKGRVHVTEEKVKANRVKNVPKKISKSVKVKKDRPKSTGSVVYLSHLPEGFEEKGIRNYLEQFGKVLGVRLVRSQKTGRSRGFAFIEFAEREVAEIVVKTMDNYLMYKRIVKAALVKPGTEVLQVRDSHPIKPENCRSAMSRNSYLRKRDRVQTDQEEEKTVVNLKKTFRRLQRQLESQGIKYEMKLTRTGLVRATGNSRRHRKKNTSLVLKKDLSDTEIDFAVPEGVQVVLD